jgi:hypothetical protein
MGHGRGLIYAFFSHFSPALSSRLTVGLGSSGVCSSAAAWFLDKNQAVRVSRYHLALAAVLIIRLRVAAPEECG